MEREGLALKFVEVLQGKEFRVYLGACSKKLDVTPLLIDVSDPESIKRSESEIHDGTDVLVNNAALLHDGNLPKVTETTLKRKHVSIS